MKIGDYITIEGTNLVGVLTQNRRNGVVWVLLLTQNVPRPFISDYLRLATMEEMVAAKLEN